MSLKREVTWCGSIFIVEKHDENHNKWLRPSGRVYQDIILILIQPIFLNGASMHAFSEIKPQSCSFTPFVFQIYRAESITYKNGAINNETSLI